MMTPLPVGLNNQHTFDNIVFRLFLNTFLRLCRGVDGLITNTFQQHGVRKLVLPGDERDGMHCVPATVPATVGSALPGLNTEVISRSNGICGNWDALGGGIVFRVVGEPKSGTTILAEAAASLAARLCGNSSNSWCRLTRLTHGFAFNFDMVHAGTGTPFLRQTGYDDKHSISGIDSFPQICGRGGRGHIVNYFDTEAPCDFDGPPTREQLLACLPDTSEQVCKDYFRALGPSVQRTVLVVRDPRNVVISEHRMREKWSHMPPPGELDAFIQARFETILAWMHHRWMWHTTALQASSHVVFLEDFEESHLGLVDLAAFIGLKCSQDEALEVWQHLRNPSPHGNFSTYGLPATTLAWMDEAMSRILPDPMLGRWGLAAHVANSHQTDGTIQTVH